MPADVIDGDVGPDAFQRPFQQPADHPGALVGIVAGQDAPHVLLAEIVVPEEVGAPAPLWLFRRKIPQDLPAFSRSFAFGSAVIGIEAPADRKVIRSPSTSGGSRR